MNLWLSPHGIWYYRKVTTLPCGRRKEIKQSLRTRDKLCARHKVAQLHTCVRSRPTSTVPPVGVPEGPAKQEHTKSVARTAKSLAPRLSVLSDGYQKGQALS
ncbi:hypothetical protein [Aeromonas intestinalis]